MKRSEHRDTKRDDVKKCRGKATIYKLRRENLLSQPQKEPTPDFGLPELWEGRILVVYATQSEVLCLGQP